MRTIHRIGTVAAATGLAATLLAAPAATAGTTTHCTAWGRLPAKVSLHSDEVVVHPILVGTSDCHGQRTDNGAKATLYPPKGTAEDMRWRQFPGRRRRPPIQRASDCTALVRWRRFPGRWP